MTYIANFNPRIFTRLQRLLGLNTQFGSSTVFLPVVNADSDEAMAEHQVILNLSTGTTSGTLGTIENSTRKDVYVTAILLWTQAESGAICAVNAVINNVTTPLLFHHSSQQAVPTRVVFKYPVKIDNVASNITVSGTPDTFNAVIIGYHR